MITNFSNLSPRTLVFMIERWLPKGQLISHSKRQSKKPEPLRAAQPLGNGVIGIRDDNTPRFAEG